MPPVIAKSLHELVKCDGHEAWALRDKFRTSIADIEYFTELSKEDDWVVISKDVANARRTPERMAILRSNVIALYLAPAVQRQRVNEQAATILWQWDKIVKQRRANQNGLFILPVGKSSKFRTL